MASGHGAVFRLPLKCEWSGAASGSLLRQGPLSAHQRHLPTDVRAPETVQAVRARTLNSWTSNSAISATRQTMRTVTSLNPRPLLVTSLNRRQLPCQIEKRPGGGPVQACRAQSQNTCHRGSHRAIDTCEGCRLER